MCILGQHNVIQKMEFLLICVVTVLGGICVDAGLLSFNFHHVQVLNVMQLAEMKRSPQVTGIYYYKAGAFKLIWIFVHESIITKQVRSSSYEYLFRNLLLQQSRCVQVNMNICSGIYYYKAGAFKFIYCRTSFIRPCFNSANFAQMTVDDFKTRVNKHSHIECIVYKVTGQIQNRSKQKFFTRGRIFCVLQ